MESYFLAETLKYAVSALQWSAVFGRGGQLMLSTLFRQTQAHTPLT